MLRLTELRLPLDHEDTALETAIRQELGTGLSDPMNYTIRRRGYDARRRNAIVLVYTVDVDIGADAEKHTLARAAPGGKLRVTPDEAYRPVALAPADLTDRPVVIGAGPCGLLAALILAQTGFRPIILERGPVVRERTRDTWRLWRRGELDPESNVQFGEGGAGTFSDGKLWSQISDPQHYGRKVLSEFVRAGAPDEILWISKPHIGTFRLVSMVEHIRAEIEARGGEYRFAARVTDLVLEDRPDGMRQVRGVQLADGCLLPCRHVVLAIGHSARDTFSMLRARGVSMRAKPFSIGVRIEHPQTMIDRDRFGPHAGNPLLGAADYRLAHHCGSGRTVYSFCMCPGGTVVAATSEAGRVVTNGMSQYSRAERNANAGIVVDVTPADYPEDILAGVALQRECETRAFIAGGGTYAAPVQRVADFLARRPSTALGTVVPSYRPGVQPTDLASCLPDFVTAAMREALPAFGRQIPGFDMDDAILTGVETRTSSPVRIERNGALQSPTVAGLFPAGEGAGFAGGILSAGVDGIRVAEAVAISMAGAAAQRSPSRRKL